MDDLIFRHAAIEEINRFLGYLDEDMLLRLSTAFKRLPPAQRWIPVTERMPDAYYLVWATDGKDVGIASFQQKGNFWLGDDNFSDYQPEVTHWMPLPELPKEET